MAKRLFLVDGTALAYRSFFAFAANPRTSLTTSSGQPTGAVFGFVQTLRSLLEREKPDAIAVAFDGPREDLYRTKIYPEYKSTRSRMPDEMAVQLDDIRKVVEGYGIRIVESPADEADDVIGTLAVQGREAGMEVYIVTGDKDFLQLVGPHIHLWNLRSSTTKPEVMGPAEVEAKWGVKPSQIVDLLALMGDSSDNVPGVPKVGEKTAVELIQQFGSLDAVLARAEEVKKPSIRQSLLENRELAELSRRLVTLQTALKLHLDIAGIGPAEPHPDLLRELFTRLEFDSLLRSLPSVQKADDVARQYVCVRTGEQLHELVRALREAGSFAVDTETTSLQIRQAKLVGLSFSFEPGKAYYVPLNAQPPVLPGGAEAVLEALRPVLEDPKLRKTGQNAKYDMGVLRGAGIDVRGLEFDTMLASYCIAPGVVSHGLDEMTLRHFGHVKIPTKQLLGTGKQQKTFDQVDLQSAAEYACEDADYTWRLRGVLAPQLAAHGVEALFHDLEMPLVPVILDMEWEGIAVDREHLERLGRDLGKRIEELERRVHERAGSEFNIGSPAQLGEVLFDKLEVHRAADIARPKRTKTGQYKTDAEVLEKLAPFHEVPQLVLEWRMLTKLKGTYVDNLPGMIDPATGRIHTSFNQAVAATGRLSSDNPNLQNIPIRTPEGQKVRSAFVSRDKDWVLLSADYSQIELRILAHLSGDKALVDSFRKGEDIHRRTAAIVHGMMPELVTPDLRNQAKVINYGLVYGMGASRLASETGLTPPEARKFIEAYFRALPGVKRYLDDSLAEARKSKQTVTMFGRKRPLPDIDADNAMIRIAAENMAVNTPIQGAAADIVKRAMLRVHDRLAKQKLRARLILQVHDELVLDVPEDELREVEILLKDAMTGAAELSVPLEVTMGHGRSWLAAH